MSATKLQKIRKVNERELKLAARAEAAEGWPRRWLSASRWVLRLYQEFLRDDVRVRAESLSYLMIFSLLPLLAGCFFICSIFAQFGMVQEALGGLVQRFLQEIPEEHRAFIAEYVLRFQQDYLHSMTQKSGRIGIFALFFLIYVGLQVFQNVDRLLNDIWSAERERTFLEQLRNFLVTAVAAPVALIAAVSVPQILQRAAQDAHVAESLGMVFSLLNAVLLPGVLFGTFLALYRFVPVANVKWSSAAAGAAFTTVAMILANGVVGIYFRYGTQTAYGKAAAFPVLAFWIYVAWIIVILGAEVSYLMQNPGEPMNNFDREPTLREGESLLAVLGLLLVAWRNGHGAVSLDALREHAKRVAPIEPERLRALLRYLDKKAWVVCSVGGGPFSSPCYALARDPDAVTASDFFADFYALRQEIPEGSPGWRKSFRAAQKKWLASFGDHTVAQLLEQRHTKS